MTSAPATALKPISPVDLAAERAQLGPALEEAMLRVLRSGQYILGPEVEAFEKAFAAYCGVSERGVAVANGTDALVVALRAASVAPGDHVVTSPFTFFASAGAIAWMGATPRLADVELDTGLLDLEQAAIACDSKTTAILPVHLYGQMVDIKGFRALCDKRGISLVEDCAQSHGASRDGIQCGQLGDAAAFSFYPTKNLGACGEGGMVLSRHAKVIEKARRIREHGSPVRYTHSELGTNSRMQGLQGAALNCKLPHLNAWNARRAEIAARYDAVLKGNAAVIPLTRRSNTVHAYHQYTVRIVGGVSRDAVLEKLKAQSIFAQVHYPSPVHLQEAAKPWGYCPGDFPNAERLAREVICLPVHPFLSNSDADRVAGCLLTASLG